MSAETYINDAGVARRQSELWVNDAGTARRIKEIWVNDNGTARQIFVDGTVDIVSASYTRTGFGTAFYELQPGGVLSTSSGDTTWISPAGGMYKYEVMATQNSQSGTATFTGGLNTWLPLTFTRLWSVNRPSSAGAGSSVWNLTFSIRRASDAVVIDTANIILTSSS